MSWLELTAESFMYYRKLNEWSHSPQLMIGIIMMMLYAVSCQPTDHPHRDHHRRPSASELKAELKQALMIDPQQLVVREATVVNMPKGGGFYDVVLSVDAHDSTQMIKVSVCKASDPSASCQDSEHLATTIKFGSEALLTDAHHQSVFKLKACVAQDYSLSADSRCGPEYTTIHTLPSRAHDATLLGYELELNRLRQGFMAWDEKVKNTMSEFQSYIDQCQGRNDEAKAANETRMWIMLGALVGTIPLMPSAMSTPSSASSEVDLEASETKPGWDQLVSEFNQSIDVLDMSALTQATECTRRHNEQGKGGLSALCGLAAAWALKQKWDELSQNNLVKVARNINSFRQQLQGLKLDNMASFTSSFDLAGMAGTLIPNTTGSPAQFVFNTMNAMMDLSATDVILPCGERQRQHNQVDLVFSQLIATNRATQCGLYTKIKDRRHALRLAPLAVDICAEINAEVAAELAKLQPSPSPSEGLGNNPSGQGEP